MITNFSTTRDKLITALLAVGVDRKNIVLVRTAPPADYPAAYIELTGRAGVNPTRRGFVGFNHHVTVSLVLAVDDSDDPDSEILAFEERFRQANLVAGNDDFAKSEYGMACGADGNLEMIARLSLGAD